MRVPLATQLAQILDEVAAVRHLHRGARTTARTVGVDAAAFATDDLDARMRRESLDGGAGIAIGQEIDDRMAFKVDEDGAVAPQTILRKRRWNGR